ncbi:MAG: class I SAM-dependent rRNA methyltransferase [Opitutales bacterium]|nr:class I SAM-dependent rRNA methyltransferase [Opitutales bacterium]
MNNPVLSLKRCPRRPRVLDGHPWVFAGEVETLLPKSVNGLAVDLVDPRRRPLGTGIYNSRSKLVWRRFARDNGVPWDDSTVAGRIEAAVARRDPSVRYGRLVWSEADDLPGLVVDRYDDVLVVQALTLAVDRLLPAIVDCLQSLPDLAEIVRRNDTPVRRQEGLDLNVSTVSGADVPSRWFSIEGIEFRLDLTGGQKTGFYLDQREQHPAVGFLAKGRRVLDAFCHQGGFALHCAKSGAASVLAIDSSAEAVENARANAARNGLTITAEAANVFDFFTAHREERGLFDLIILDPPPFARSRSALDGALRGYKELNLRALRLLSPGGILATYTCSQPVDRALFRSVLADAAHDARRSVTILGEPRQPADHPVRLDFPESEYLRGYWLQAD